MEKLLINNNTIHVENNSYSVIEVDTNTLSDEIKDKNGNPINNGQGVYIFISNRDMPKFNSNFFNKEFVGVFFVNNRPSIKTIEVPPFNNLPPKKDCIFYVGRANKIADRLKQHWTQDKINGCKSLKLGCLSRKWIKKFLKVYVIMSCVDKNNPFDYKQLEKDIRNYYGAAFGK